MMRCMASLLMVLLAPLRADAGDALAQALARMSSEGKPGIVVVVPSEETAAAVVADQLGRVFIEGGAPARRLLCEAVLVCVREGTSIDGADPDWNLLLIDTNGKAIDGRRAPAADLGRQFTSIAGDLLHGDGDARLTERAASESAALGADVAKRIDAAVAVLGEGEFDEREAASRVLAELAPRAVTIIALAFARSSDPEAQARIQAVFDGMYESGPDGVPGPRQPHGAVWAESEVDAWNLGATVASPHRRRFLLFQER